MIDQTFPSHADDDGSDQRMVSSTLSFRVFAGSNAIQGIVNTSMLPGSMVEEANLVKIRYQTVVSSISYPLFASSHVHLLW